MDEHHQLYAIAKKITLEAGYPYTDPRTLETTQPRKKKMNKIKKPAWVLFEQLHVDVSISTRMSVGDRSKLKKTLDAPALQRAIENLIPHAHTNAFDRNTSNQGEGHQIKRSPQN